MNKIEQQVMASVGVIYTARRLTSRTALKCYALAASAAGVLALVSLPSVVDNFLHVAEGGVGSIATFLVVAIVSTHVVVQLALVVGAIALASLFVDLRSSVTSSRSFAA